jgi:uncharacterized protein (DUF1919 family)
MWSIISNNCWGSRLYTEVGLPYNTPTVGLWFEADDYIRFLTDFRRMTTGEISFISHAPRSDEYPVGIIQNSVKVHFLHFKNSEEARLKWVRRCARLPTSDDDLYFKVCDRDGFKISHLASFSALPYKNKVVFLKQGRFSFVDRPWIHEVRSDLQTVPDGMSLWTTTKSIGSFNPYKWVGQAPN